MIGDNDIPDKLDDDEEYEDELSFNQLFYEALAPKIKQFLADYCGDRIYNLNPETYLEIEETIKEDLKIAVEIPGVLYRYRTITDSEQFDEALANFVPPKTGMVWQKHENWFDRDYSQEEDEDTFLEDSNPVDLTENQQKAKEIIRLADDITENTRRFAHFIKSGYEIVMKETQLFLERNASFDLSILSAEGFDELHQQMNSLMEILLEDLYAVVYGEQ